MAQRCGLSKGYFRPSDDAVTFSYHVPSQAMAVVEAGALLLPACLVDLDGALGCGITMH